MARRLVGAFFLMMDRDRDMHESKLGRQKLSVVVSVFGMLRDNGDLGSINLRANHPKVEVRHAVVIVCFDIAANLFANMFHGATMEANVTASCRTTRRL